MRRTPRSDGPRLRHGFTLVELVLAITITGVIAAVGATFIVPAVQSYLAQAARAGLVDEADVALRRIGRDLRSALPNSVRVTASGLALELVPTTAGARYFTAGTGVLEFGVVDTSFDIVGPPLDLAAGQALVVYNLGTGVVGADVYAPNGSAVEQATSNRRSSANGAGPATTVTLTSSAALPVTAFAPPHRVLAVDPPVSYRCDLASGQLLRHRGYGFVAAQPDPPVGGTVAVLATGVTGCRFATSTAVVAARAALVHLQLTLATTTSAGTESVALHHAVHVSNLP
jgi:MSHA biogenesis protein MshO